MQKDITCQYKARSEAPKRTIEEARDLLLLLLPNEKNPNIDKYVLPHYIKASALIKIESKKNYMKQA
jgi:hypothetical protein